MRAEVLADSDAGRPAISASALRSAVRYVAGIAALAAPVLRRGAGRLCAGLRGPGRRDRVAPGRRRRQLPLPRRPALLAGRAHRRPARQRLRRRSRSARPSRRRRATCSRCSPRRCSCAACCGAAPPLGSVARPGRMLFALAAGTVVSATIGTVALRLGGVVADAQIAHVWRTWWLGDFAGALVVVPLAIAWFRPSRLDGWNGGLIEGTIVLARRRRPDATSRSARTPRSPTSSSRR